MKNNIKLLQLLSLIFTACINIQSGCVKTGGNCELPDRVENSSFVFIFKDKSTGNYLYTPYTTSIYKIDSLKILDEQNNSYIIRKSSNNVPNSPQTYWDISIAPIYRSQTDAGSFTNEVCKKYFIKYAYNEVDTIKVCFMSKNTKCGSQFSHLNLFYKGDLIGSTSNEVNLRVTINK